MKFSVIEDAFDFVNFSSDYERTAFVSRTTGRVYLLSESMDDDEESEVPEEVADDPDYIALPYKNDLELGQRLVWQFVAEEMPDEEDTVRALFTRNGAYQRFKVFLEGVGFLKKWYEFEAAKTRAALLAWCKEEGLVIEEGKAKAPPVQSS